MDFYLSWVVMRKYRPLAFQQLSYVVRQGERAAVEFRVVVPRGDTERVPAVGVEVAHGIVLERGEPEEPVPRGIAWDMALVDRRDGELVRDVRVGILHARLVGGVERRLVLVDEDTVVLQRVAAVAVELAGEEAFGRAVGVGTVDDDEVVGVVLAAHEAEALLEVHPDARVAELAGRERQVYGGERDDLLVALHQVDLLDAGIFH